MVVTPTIQSVHTSSVAINLNAKLAPKNPDADFEDSTEVLLSFRAFGSAVEEKRKLLLRTRGRTEEEHRSQGVIELSRNYVINNLLSDTGYVFCFALPPPVQSQEEKMADKTRDETSTGVQSSPLEKNAQIDKTTPFPPRRYAYSSTGELIYLPASSWMPHFRSKRNNQPSQQYCLEIKTSKKATFTPLFMLTISLSFIAILIAVLLVIFLCRKKPCCFEDKTLLLNRCKKKLKTQKAKKLKTEEMAEKEKSSEKESTDGNKKDKETNSKDKLSEKHFSLSKLSHFCQKTYIKDKSTPNAQKCNCLSHSDFHPGYQLPPTSTVEVYGYDYPKTRNTEGPLSPTASSCELNDVSDGFWDSISSRFNLNIPYTHSKHSDFNKCIDVYQSPSIDKPQISSFVSGLGESQYTVGLDPHAKGGRPPCETCRYFNGENANYNIRPTQKAYLELESCDNIDSRQEKSEQKKNLGGSRTCQSLGDITISGGTLIEVPDGYVVPKPFPSSAVIQIKVKNENSP